MFKIYASNPRKQVGSHPTYTVIPFSGGEVHVRINEWKTEHFDVVIEANLTDSAKIMELVMLVDAFRRIDPTVKLHLVTPYLPYARQDRVCTEGEALAVRVMADLINSLNFETVEVWDVHSDVSIAVLNRADNIGPETFLENVLGRNRYRESATQYVLVSPDAGAMKKVTKVSKKFNLPMLTASKIRDPKTGEITGTEIHIPEEHYTKTFLIVDDICDGGRTFTELAKAIKTEVGRGAYEKAAALLPRGTYGTFAAPIVPVELYVTHGIFSKGLDVITEAGIRHIYTANPFPNVDLNNPNLTVVQV